MFGGPVVKKEQFNKMALYKQIEMQLKRQITDKKYNVGDKVPTESELMETYQVSRMTAKKALDKLVDDGLIERHPGKGSFVIHTMSEPAIPDRPLTIGLVVPRTAPSFGITMISEISALCHQLNINLLYDEIPHNTFEEESQAIQRLRDVADGLIIWPIPGKVVGNEILKLIIENYPVVLLDRYIQEINASYVVTDNSSAIKMALEHLAQLGHRHLCLVPKENVNDISIQDRVRFVQTKWAVHQGRKLSIMHSRGIHFDRPEEVEQEKARLKVRLAKLLKDNPEITAFFVTKYYPATVIYDALQELGYNVPEDFSIICYDSPVFYTDHVVKFTHIQQNEKQLANDAVDLITKLIQKSIQNQPKLEEATLVEGDTTAVAK